MASPRAESPLVVTAYLDGALFAVLDELRERHFPAHLNKVPAHVSLFHQLPGAEERAVLARVRQLCRGVVPLDLGVGRWASLGRGVAIRYPATGLTDLRAKLAVPWQDWLTRQDRQAFRAHVTIQNKVELPIARALLAELEGRPAPSGLVRGLTVWRYLGGPWARVETCLFAGQLPEITA